MSDWTTTEASTQENPSVPVSWPAATVLRGPKDLTLSVGARSVPDWISINAYNAVHEVTGEPGSEPAISYECSRYSGDACAYSSNGESIQVYGLPSRLFDSPFLTVFCSWTVPLPSRPGGSPGDASAAWLFRVHVLP